MKNRLFSSYLVVVILLAASFASTCALAGEDDRYVWAAQGLNLRDAPSADGHIIKKLAYGTPVHLLPAHGAAMLYDMDFFPKVAPVPGTKPRAVVVLHGAWVEVQANGDHGYAFDKLLLTYSPAKKSEGTSTYFARLFGLKAQPAKKKSKDGMSETIYLSPSDSKMRMSVSKSEQDGAEGGELFIPNMSFDDAVVLINAIQPILLNDASSELSYKKEESLDYSTEYGGRASIERKNGGILLTWQDGD